MTRFGVIYTIWFPNGKGYCGQTIDFNARFVSHKRATVRGSMLAVCCAIRKYGWDNLRWVIEYDNVPEADLNRLEIDTIGWFGFYGKAGYNVTVGGRVGNRGYHHTEETKELLRIARSFQREPKLGYKCTPEQCANIGRAKKGIKGLGMSGKHHSEETKKKLSEYFSGKPGNRKGAVLSDSSKLLMRLAKLGKKRSLESIEKSVASRRGYRHSQATKDAISNSNRANRAKKHIIVGS